MNKKRYILIIDDSAEDRTVLRRTLKQVPDYHYMFTEIELGEQALQQVEGLAPDCILLDYQLPDMNGIEVLEHIRAKSGEIRHVPVVMLTGLGDETLAVRAIRTGAQDYLKKHEYSVERLHTSISNAIDFMALNSALQKAQAQTLELFTLEKAARIQAEEANRQKVQFMGMVAHELASPLATIKTLANSMLSEKATFEQARRILKLVADESDRLYGLVSELLDLSRLKSAKLVIHPQEKHLCDVLDDLELQLSVMTANHRLIVDVSKTLPHVWVDAPRMMQVITNLVSNAVKFSPPNTSIVLTAFAIEGALQIQVSDQGKGIPPEKKELVFEAFQQVTSLHSFKGTGLGLTICKGIVEAHGGQMWIADRTPGTTVCFTLPTVVGAPKDTADV